MTSTLIKNGRILLSMARSLSKTIKSRPSVQRLIPKPRLMPM